MKKFINTPESYVDDMLTGLVMAHPDIVRKGKQGRTLARRDGVSNGRVGIATGGGAGHLPLFAGYLGEGFADSCAVGNVFEGPNLQSCVDAINLADGGSGVLLLYGNYGGDRMNFDMASKLAATNDIETVLATDDIASASREEMSKRRGVAGIVFAYKAAGAAARTGASLKDVADIARRTVARTRTIGLGMKSCRLPGATGEISELGDNEVELGLGIHGEPGLWRRPMASADALVDEMISRLLEEGPDDKGHRRLAVMVNGLGATPLEELYIAFRRVGNVLAAQGLHVVMPLVGSFATSMEMAGLSVTLCFLDDELEKLLSAQATCPFWSVQ
ncbi:dihydroxyacetone kinase, N-terminal domain [Rhizobium mongolense subsp. loessense]|uniref:Dihydroxyacetone kinase, N-terminal domain n=1 Tax=Rhizobium mongolense subsp. loessense TaxID=158890 RepID=A0A1G4SBU0_9HYPH|nr:dihydroxyacetone kinase subunit DhaK [Rhizobium mongolense]SCW66663.1 dihydroxyacetone kinase, N-terminal domain [Rhizobium mongolense subsp. loessense]